MTTTIHEQYEEAVKAQREASLRWKASGSDADWFTFTAAVHVRERLSYLAHSCYGPAFKCISCGCRQGAPCISHQGSPKHTAELLERIAVAVEGQARFNGFTAE